MEYSAEARQRLTEVCEGLRLVAYPDPGTGGAPWTIGYGHTGADVYEGLTCTSEQADTWLLDDVQSAVNAVNVHVTVAITQHQFDALVDFAFNCGAGNFESSTLLELLNAGNAAGADEQFARWVRGGGHILPGLVKRRALEAAWFNTEDA